MSGTQSIGKALERARGRLDNVEIPAMDGDNLAVTLCSCFDDADGEQDDNGWTQAATDGCDATLAAIHQVYVDAIAIAAPAWQPIETAPKDGTDFLSSGGVNGDKGKSYPTRWLSPGPYTTENGKNTEGQRRFQWPDGFYWAGYDGFVGPIDPTHWLPLPAAPEVGS